MCVYNVHIYVHVQCVCMCIYVHTVYMFVCVCVRCMFVYVCVFSVYLYVCERMMRVCVLYSIYLHICKYDVFLCVSVCSICVCTCAHAHMHSCLRLYAYACMRCEDQRTAVGAVRHLPSHFSLPESVSSCSGTSQAGYVTWPRVLRIHLSLPPRLGYCKHGLPHLALLHGF